MTSIQAERQQSLEIPWLSSLNNKSIPTPGQPLMCCIISLVLEFPICKNAELKNNN